MKKQIKISEKLRSKIELINSKYMPDVIKEVRGIIEEMIPEIVIDEDNDRFFDGKTVDEIREVNDDFFLEDFVEGLGFKVIASDLHYSENELEEIKNILNALDSRETVINLKFLSRFDGNEEFYNVYVTLEK